MIPDLEEVIATIEVYHPLDVECAAASLVLLRAIRECHPSLQYLLDGDGDDENLKAYRPNPYEPERAIADIEQAAI